MRPFHYASTCFCLAVAAVLAGWYLYNISFWWLLAPALIYLHLLVLGAIFIRWNFYLKSVHRGSNSTWISLTFDDGPAEETSAILDILKREKVSAAFFTIGKRAAARPELVKRWHDEGHIIGNHSYEHGFHFDWKSARSMALELRQTNELVEKITGRKLLFFRPPYGVTNPNVARAVRMTGMTSIGWSIRSFDTTAKDEQDLLARILSQLKGGDIILLHDSMGITKNVLTSMIQGARQKGFTFVRLDQLTELNAYS